MSIQCIIIDDEKPARDLIRAYAEEVSHLNVIGDYQNPVDAMATLSNNKIDLIFLDIQMPGLTGLDFIKTLTSKPAIVITTAYPQYAIEGFELDVLDYLMKPISFERFLKSVNKLKQVQTPVTIPERKENYLYFKADGQKHRVNVDEVLFVEGMKEYVKIVSDEKSLVTLASLKNLEIELPNSFIRVHKSFIINKEKVNSYSSTQIVINGIKIPIGRQYTDQVLKDLY